MSEALLFNGRTTTLDPARPSATAMALENGVFAAGDDREIRVRRTPNALTIDRDRAP